MKLSNAVVGMEVQVKHNCQGHSGEFIKEGLVCTVDKVMGDDYELRLLNPDIDMGFAWVNASDVRRYTKEPAVVEPKELTLGDTNIGDWVVCSTSKSLLTVGVAYRVTGYTAWGSLLISNPTKDCTHWADGYAVVPKYFNKVLREVNDATPRS